MIRVEPLINVGELEKSAFAGDISMTAFEAFLAS
jgi:hypothetical protein